MFHIKCYSIFNQINAVLIDISNFQKTKNPKPQTFEQYVV